VAKMFKALNVLTLTVPALLTKKNKISHFITQKLNKLSYAKDPGTMHPFKF
jgi:transcriptional regulator of aromatic amino acid metabolism